MVKKAATELRDTVLQNTAPSPEQGHPLAAPHTSYTPALLATREDWIQLSSSQMAPIGAGCWAPVGSQCHVPFTPSMDLMLLCISRDAAAAGHCERLEAACIVRAVSTATSSRDILWFTFSTSLLRNLNCLFNPLALGQKHSAVQPSTAGTNLIPIETENLPGIKIHMGTI